MSISKQKIISELKEKITEFKSKFKSGKSNEDNKENDLLEFPLNQDTLNNYYKLSKNIFNKNDDNKDNKNDNIINQIKAEKIKSEMNILNNTNYAKKERANSTSISSFGLKKKYLDFDIDKIIKKSKKPNLINEYDASQHNLLIMKNKSSNNLDFNNIYPNKNSNQKNFININICSKKTYPNTDRKKELFPSHSNYNLNYCPITDNNFKYEPNHSEPNISNNNINNLYKYNFTYKTNRYQNKFVDFENELKSNKKERQRYSAKPEIRADVSKYDLKFMNNNFTKSNTKYNYNNNSINNILNTNNFNKYNGKNNYTKNIRAILNTGKKSNSYYSMNGLNDKYLTNYYKHNQRKKFIKNFENEKSYNFDLNEIHKVKYMIQNLSNNDINNMPIVVFREMKDLYDLINKKFFMNNEI